MKGGRQMARRMVAMVAVGLVLCAAPAGADPDPVSDERVSGSNDGETPGVAAGHTSAGGTRGGGGVGGPNCTTSDGTPAY